jgi:aminomethyltransferase
MAQDLLPTPLTEWHRVQVAKLVGFAGYSMPVQYPDGIIKEHLHTRAAAGLFDVSHMGQVRIHCPLTELARLLPTDLAALGVMRSAYSLLLNQAGGVVDDLIITRLNSAGDEWHCVINAARKHYDLDYLRQHLPQAQFQLHDDRALLALQGPLAVSVMQRLWPAATQLGFMQACHIDSDWGELFVTRSGYTGEDGFEIGVAAETVVAMAESLLRHDEVKPAGLGARDTLRLEAGLCLYGHELDETITPTAAKLAWVIGKARRQAQDFFGAEIIMKEMSAGAARQRVGLQPEGRAICREPSPIKNAAGAIIGAISSGGFSPSLNRPIAMGYVDQAYAKPDTAVYLELRGQSIPARVTALPFIPHKHVRS